MNYTSEIGDLRYEIALLLARLAGLTNIVLNGGANTFVWRPGGVAGANVYTTWPAVRDAVLASNGPAIIQPDETIVPGGCVITTSANFGPTNRVQFYGPDLALVTIADGVQLQGISGSTGVQWVNNSATDVTVKTSGTFVFTFDGESTMESTSTGAFIRASGSATVNILLKDASGTVTAGTGPCFATDATPGSGGMGIFAYDNCNLDTNTLADSTGTLDVIAASPSSNISLVQVGCTATGGVLVPFGIPGVFFGDIVAQQLPGNRSYRTTARYPDFTAADGAAHVAATIPLMPTLGTNPPATNVAQSWDIVVGVANATDSRIAKFTVNAQTVGPVAATVTAGVNQNVTAGAVAWTITCAFVGGNIVITTASAAGAVTSVSADVALTVK